MPLTIRLPNSTHDMCMSPIASCHARPLLDPHECVRNGCSFATSIRIFCLGLGRAGNSVLYREMSVKSQVKHVNKVVRTSASASPLTAPASSSSSLSACTLRFFEPPFLGAAFFFGEGSANAVSPSPAGVLAAIESRNSLYLPFSRDQRLELGHEVLVEGG
jgi:hypothetical protein